MLPKMLHQEGNGNGLRTQDYSCMLHCYSFTEDCTDAEFAVAVKDRYNQYEKLIELLGEAANQIEYLQSKFQETGSGNAVLSRIKSVLNF